VTHYKLPKVQKREGILKAARQKCHIKFKIKFIRITDFLAGILKSRGNGMIHFNP
jgi:hypothetical protein